MAAQFRGAQWTVSATAASISSLIGKRAYIVELKVQNADASTAPVFIGPSTVTNVPANAYGKANSGAIGGEYSLTPADGRLDTDAIFVVGTVGAANIAFITAIE